MGFSDLLSFFSLSVLDTRLDPPQDEKRRQQTINDAGPPRWKTTEFYIYGFIFLMAVPMMFKAAMDASRADNINYPKYEHKLQDGWMFGRKVDNSDLQYSTIRNNLPILIGVLILHFICQQARKRTAISWAQFNLFFSFVFLFVIHGINTFKITGLLGVNFYIAKNTTGRTAIILSWVFGVGLLFANELFEGYPFRRIFPPLEFLDQYGGILPRWDVNFNFSMIRMISFNMDYFQATADVPSSSDKDKKKPSEKDLSEKQRIEIPLPLAEYSFFKYLTYVLYAPLYMAGPVVTYNDFWRQSRNKLPSITVPRVSVYALRFLFCVLTMEFILHYMYVVAISQTRAWENDTPFQISMIALINLNVIWLKLLIPWRLFRLWALTDGIDPPENMIRCVNNNYSALSFWRSWHRSFNKWSLRYIYIPLGGSKHPVINSLVVFSFVAIWHDIQLRLLLWGWLVVLFILPEIAAGLLFPAKKWKDRKIYRHLCALGGVVNVWMMMIANLIGFCTGLDGMADMLHDMFRTSAGLSYVIFSSCALFVGIQAMFEFRETEKRRGVNLRC